MNEIAAVRYCTRISITVVLCRYCIKAKSKPPALENIDMTDFYDDDYDIEDEYDEDDEEDEEAGDDTDDSGTGKVRNNWRIRMNPFGSCLF